MVFYSFISPAAPGGIWGAYRCGAKPMGVNLAAVRERGVLGPHGAHREGHGRTPMTGWKLQSFAMFFPLGAGASVYTVALYGPCS